MLQLLAESVRWTVVALVAYGLSKLLRCRLNSDPCAPKIRSVWLPLVPLAATLLGLIALSLWAPRNQEGLPMSLRLTFWRSVGFLINVLPAGLAMFRSGEPIRSTGLGRHNLWQACVIGLVLGGIWCLPAALGQKLAPQFGGWAGWLLFMAMVGFAEEFLFRGYLQTRLIARLGMWRGWVLAASLFAASHLPRYLFHDGLGPGAAIVATAQLIPSGLALGFIMLRTQNLLAPAILHTMTDF
ncbi:MAG TPA: CPBP family intramembrane glutamic endopeptidase [Bacillota bacterium]|nr:CPBP family intramembrane glutamic endopeptidase [Bacillota bacterium]